VCAILLSLFILYLYLFFCFVVLGIREAHKAGKIGSLIGVEGGHSLGNSLAVLRIFHSLGARYLTLTHTCDTLWWVKFCITAVKTKKSDVKNVLNHLSIAKYVDETENMTFKFYNGISVDKY